MTPSPSPVGGGRSTGSPIRPDRTRSAGQSNGSAVPRTPAELDEAAGPLGDLTDAELLAAHVNGSPLAFSVLVTRHRDRMWAVALRTMRNPEEAADALQEAYIAAFRRAGSFRGDAQVTTWLHRVVVNSCLDRIRRNKVRAADPLPEDPERAEQLAATTDTTDQVLAGEQRADIVSALGTLNADQRAALVLVDMEGYSVEEAAGMLGCATGTVKSRCARGRAKLVPLLRHLREPDAPAVRPKLDARTEAGRRPGTSRPTRLGRESR